MSRSEPKLRAALAAPALALSLFQCWYAYLPDVDAVAFHHCRFNAHLDCYKSLSMHGAGMRVLGVSVLAMIATAYFAMTLLLAAAALAGEPRRTGWRAWASVLAFPAAGLSVFVLLKDVQDGATSLSTLLVLGLGLALCVLTVLRGIPTPALRATTRGFLGLFGLALIAGFLIQGTGSARLAVQDLELVRLGEPAQLRWPRFAHAIPRVGAAHLGSPTAGREVLVVVDPSQEESRAVMRAAAQLAPTLGDAIAIFVYAPTDPRLLAAHRRGRLEPFLRDPASTAAAPPSPEFERQKRALAAAGVDAYPTVWTRDGRTTGAVDLAAVLAALRRG